MNIKEILEKAIEAEAADVFIIAGAPVSIRQNRSIVPIDDKKLWPEDTLELIKEIYGLTDQRSMETLEKFGDDDFAVTIPGMSRFRVSTYRQRGSFSAVIRVIAFQLPDFHEFNIPEYIVNLGRDRKGMTLITGPAASGKSTTLACIIDRINHERNSHVITLEDPVEYLHRHGTSVISQREINLDSESYVKALRAALRQSPDVILLGEMRDYETINVAMTAAETGHLLFSTLHTLGASNAIDRIIDVFPADQQRQIAVQLSMVLNAVVSQQLVPSVSGGVVPVFEIMTVTPAIRNMIRDNKVHQIEGLLYSSSQENMISTDQSLLKLYRNGEITRDTALTYATNPELLEKKL